MDNIKLELTIQEIERLLQYAAKRPYEEVFQLIGKVQSQVHAQQEETNPVPEEG